MDRSAVLTTFDAQLRNTVHPTAEGRYERVGPVIRCVAETPGDWSWIEWSDLDETNADQVIAEQLAYFGDRRLEWKYYTHDRPADLPDRLRSAGLEPGVDEALMVAEIAELPTDLAPPDGIELTAVTDEAGIDLLVQVHDQVFGDDHSTLRSRLLNQLSTAPETMTPILALAGDRPVCASRVDFHIGTEFASLWGGGTLPEWRGRGIYRAMVAFRARLAADRGYRYLRTDALPTSEPILARLGFERLTTTVAFTRPA
jgi:GNAT superfamily N-acetyltransferase